MFCLFITVNHLMMILLVGYQSTAQNSQAFLLLGTVGCFQPQEYLYL